MEAQNCLTLIPGNPTHPSGLCVPSFMCTDTHIDRILKVWPKHQAVVPCKCNFTPFSKMCFIYYFNVTYILQRLTLIT